MGKHEDHNMHDNSLDAYADGRKELDGRSLEILKVMHKIGKPSTVRQVLDAYCEEHDVSLELKAVAMVQPRMSELAKDGLIVEVGKTKCHVTGNTVAQYDLHRGLHQAEMDV